MPLKFSRNDFYDRTIGYSPLNQVDEGKMLNVIKINRRIIGHYYYPQVDDLILVAGAGLGIEAIHVANEYNLKTIGVDLNIAPAHKFITNPNVSFQRQDISSLAFQDSFFSLIYCYHVLEHVNDHIAVLSELKRVLRPGGVLFIGFPNKNRLFSYIGTSQKASVLDKIRWNLSDYGYRLKGKFENRFGAHAGFTEREFLSTASTFFSDIHAVRNQYMIYKYPRCSGIITILIKEGFNELLFPSNYYICIKH